MASNAYTGPEIYAMQVYHLLEAINGIDLASVILRGKLLREIEDRELWRVPRATSAARPRRSSSQGKLSATQQNFVKGMRDIVFPYVRERLGMSVVEFWAQVGKSQPGKSCLYSRPSSRVGHR